MFLSSIDYENALNAVAMHRHCYGNSQMDVSSKSCARGDNVSRLTASYILHRQRRSSTMQDSCPRVQIVGQEVLVWCDDDRMRIALVSPRS